MKRECGKWKMERRRGTRGGWRLKNGKGRVGGKNGKGERGRGRNVIGYRGRGVERGETSCSHVEKVNKQVAGLETIKFLINRLHSVFCFWSVNQLRDFPPGGFYCKKLLEQGFC